MLKILKTKDNSVTLLNEKLNAHYHSLNGAVQESLHVFVNNGFKYTAEKTKSNIHILEVGFGTGLNCLLTFTEWQGKYRQNIHYTAIEKFPIDETILTELLNYQPFCDNKKLFREIHLNPDTIYLEDNFILKKIYQDIEEALKIIPAEVIDVVYYDAFAPSAQPEMWNENIFSELYNKMKNNSVLVTFCAKGEFKRMLKRIGFAVEALKGAAGKREMTRAVKRIV